MYVNIILFTGACRSSLNAPAFNHKIIHKELKKALRLSKQEITLLEKALEIYKDSIKNTDQVVFTQLDAWWHGFPQNGISLIISNDYYIFCNSKDGSIKLYSMDTSNLNNKILQAVKNQNIAHLKEYAAKESSKCSHCGIIVIVYKEGEVYKKEVINEFLEIIQENSR